jgi:cation:H+ antiporter
VIWIAGIQLSNTTDVLDDRLHLGSALGGVVLLAIATNLPEIAITVAAAVFGRWPRPVSSLLPAKRRAQTSAAATVPWTRHGS